MREIKFRAWDGKKMHYQVRFGGVEDGIPLSPSGWDEKIGWTILSGNPVLEIMQFTGLYDKNGKEIYEGDILYIPSWKRKYKVVFEAGMFRGKSICRWTESKASLATFQGEVGCKVIGNIYENPELIRT